MTITGKQWRFLDSGKGSASFNMALDEAIFEKVSAGESPPTIRVYQWAPNAVTVGYTQKAGDFLDIELLKKDRIDLTRRMTGGRAVFHSDEIAYSVISSLDDEYFSGTILETYRAISILLCEGINRLGIESVLSRGETPQHNRTFIHEKGIVSRAPCFASTSLYEITIDGKKLVGSAQRRHGNYFIQQGSILTGPGNEKLALYIRDKKIYEAYFKILREKTAYITLSANDTRERLKQSLKQSFAGKLPLFEGQPTEDELELAEKLVQKRYARKGWVMNDA